MRRLLGPLLILTLAASGCQLPAPTKVAGSLKPSVKPAAASPKPTPTPKASPEGPTRLVKGLVRADAHYLLGLGAGTLIGNNGGGILSDNGLGIIGNNGAGVILVDGQSVPVLANNGAGIVSNNGGGLRAFGLLATSEVPVGQELAIQGMAVVAVSLLSGKPISAAVRTDAGGQFSVAVPEAIAENIRLVAKVPTAQADDPLQRDPRLEYNVLVAKSATESRVDDGTRAANRFLRELGRERIKFLFTDDPVANEFALKDPAFSGPTQAIVMQMAKEFQAAVAAAKVPTAALPQLVQRILDASLAYVDVAAIPIDTENTVWKGAPAGAKALPVLSEVLDDLRAAAVNKMKSDPTYFDHAAYLVAANTRRAAAGLPPYQIRRPADFVDFVFDEYIAFSGVDYDRMDEVLLDVGLTERSDGVLTAKAKLSASAKSIFLQIGLTMMTRPEAKQAGLAIIKELGQ